jgi:hypothetical protein
MVISLSYPRAAGHAMQRAAPRSQTKQLLAKHACTNSTTAQTSTSSIGTGLFDFNKDIHDDPSFIANRVLGYSLLICNAVVCPQP